MCHSQCELLSQSSYTDRDEQNVLIPPVSSTSLQTSLSDHPTMKTSLTDPLMFCERVFRHSSLYCHRRNHPSVKLRTSHHLLRQVQSLGELIPILMQTGRRASLSEKVKVNHRAKVVQDLQYLVNGRTNACMLSCWR